MPNTALWNVHISHLFPIGGHNGERRKVRIVLVPEILKQVTDLCFKTKREQSLQEKPCEKLLTAALWSISVAQWPSPKPAEPSERLGIRFIKKRDTGYWCNVLHNNLKCFKRHLTQEKLKPKCLYIQEMYLIPSYLFQYSPLNRSALNLLLPTSLI